MSNITEEIEKLAEIKSLKIQKENIKKELFEMKYLFGYERGRVISEQALPMEEFEDVETDFVDVSDIDTSIANKFYNLYLNLFQMQIHFLLKCTNHFV